MESWQDIIRQALPTLQQESYNKLITHLADIGVGTYSDLQFVTLEDVKDAVPLIAARRLIHFLKNNPHQASDMEERVHIPSTSDAEGASNQPDMIQIHKAQPDGLMGTEHAPGQENDFKPHRSENDSVKDPEPASFSNSSASDTGQQRGTTANFQPSTEQTTEVINTQPQKAKEDVKEMNCGISENDILNLLKRLKLDFTHAITTSKVLEVSSYSLNLQESKTERELANVFLQKLLTANYNARYTSIKEETPVSDSDFRKCQDANETNAFCALFQTKNVARSSTSAQIHPMDVQMAVFHCADHFVKQLIVTKLSQCQYALPLLVPNPFKPNEIQFPLWTFHQIKKSWKTTDRKGEVFSKSQSVCKAETPMVAFFRLGSVSSSKSQLMNSLINEKHNTFFHRNCPGSSKTRLLMDGVVEIAWYCPSGKPTDKFTDCVAFCNLHGDAGANPVQRRIVTEMATINVVFISELKENGTNMTIVQELFESPKPLIYVLTEDENSIVEMRKGKYKLGLKSRNQSDVSKELCGAVKQNLPEGTVFNMENMLKYPEIKVDTESEECRRGKDAALQIMELLGTREPSTMKETFLPCQGKLWHDWSKISKDLNRLRGDEPEKDKLKKQNNMKAIRLKQREHGLTMVMKQFTEYLKSLSDAEKKYFLKWVGGLLDDFASDKLSDLLQQYDVKWKQVLALKNTHHKSEEMEAEQNELETISNKLITAMFGLEHFVREMGQVYESWKSQAHVEIRTQKDKAIQELPKMAAELMISGHPVELMDGDAAHVPLIWITAVLDELIKILGDQRVFVLSVLGIQSSGKSTMLNAMFGLQFAVSAGRCTRGAFMQLVKLSEEMKGELKFDYILVVDTEGLRALELAGKVTVHHDNELATFVVGLGNMTLINIFGENPSEMQDILQIVVQAFLRMNKVKLNPSCMFVHQNVTDVTAGEKNMEGKRRLQEKLDEMTKLAAKEEVCNAECFRDVIAFDIQKDVKYFSQLWEGSPPMAPPNPSYSENIHELRKTIVTQASKSSGLTLTELKERVKDLWNALLSEDFVFSFKNTLEITAYRTLEEEYGKWTWTLRSEMLKIEDTLHTTIINSKQPTVSKSLLVESIRETLQNVEKDMSLYFDNDKSKEILIQWKAKFEIKIKELHSDLVDKATAKLNNVISQRDARKKLDEKKDQHDKKLFDKSKELALKLKQNGNDEMELKKAFDSMWEEWVVEVKSQTTPISDINVRQDIFNILYEIFEYNLVQERMTAREYTKINQIGDYTHYVTISRGVSDKIRDKIFGEKGLKPEDNSSIKELVNDIARQTDRLVKSKPDKGYNPSYIQEMAHLVMKLVKEYNLKTTTFEFKREFKVDLSFFVCERAVEKFVELHKMFREANDPHIYLEKKKPEYYKVFKIYCHGANCTAVLGNLICNELREPILSKAYNRSATDIAGEMRTQIPEFSGNRSNMEKHILRTLAEKEDFEQFMSYIQNPREYFEEFIYDKVMEYLSKCSPSGDLIILIMIKDHINELQKRVITAAVTATQEVKQKKEDSKRWLQLFSDGLTDVLENRCTDLSGENVKDFDLLVDIIKKELACVTKELNSQLNSLGDLNMNMFRERPDEILIEHFCQCCWIQCPFCKAICTNTMEDHPGDHNVAFHRPIGISGWRYTHTDRLCLDFCTTLVVSDKSFSSSFVEYTPFKKYRSAGGNYATWSITQDNSELPYWKWFVCRFQTQLEKYHNKKLDPVVREWKYAQKDALESLDKL